MVTAARDPNLTARSPSGWKRWLVELGRNEQSRVAESGAILLGGLLSAVALLYVFAWLAYEVLEQQTQALDATTLTYLQRFSSPQLTLAAQAASTLGSQAVFLVGGALFLFFGYQRRWGAAVTLLVIAAGAQGVNDLLKELFHRARPTTVSGFIEAQQYSFPSGHAMLAAAFYLYVAYVTWHLVRGRWRVGLIVLLIALVLLIGLSRLYLEAHYLSDVVAGYLAGFLWADAVILASRLLSVRARRRSPVHAT